jgi:hypothetical protein
VEHLDAAARTSRRAVMAVRSSSSSTRRVCKEASPVTAGDGLLHMCVRHRDVRRVLGDVTSFFSAPHPPRTSTRCSRSTNVPTTNSWRRSARHRAQAAATGVGRRVGDYGGCGCSTAAFASARFSTRTRYRGGLGPFASRRLQRRDPWPAPERTCLIWPHLVRLRSETAHAHLPGDANKAPSACLGISPATFPPWPDRWRLYRVVGG